MFRNLKRSTENLRQDLLALNQLADVDTRFELKYRLTYFQYLKFRNAIKPYMNMDAYTFRHPSHRYLVRSLYFDTMDYHAYDQKIDGDNCRAKFRMRTYTKIVPDVRTVRIELKLREGNHSIKKSVFVPMEEYLHFMRHRHWDTFQNPITTEFERRLLTTNLRPMVLVEYDREGYQTKLKSNLRITFDHNLRSSHANTLFPEDAFFRKLLTRVVTLEIKFKDSRPLWLENLVRDHGLKVQANSKFTQCIQIGRNDLHHPENVILVR